MNWTYEQATGRFLDCNGAVLAVGYSGNGPGKNNPAMEDVLCIGPIPRGEYAIGAPFRHPSKGPVCMRLTPVGHDAHGRSGFLIHGDSARHPGTASEGCIILPRPARDMIAASGIGRLIVT